MKKILLLLLLVCSGLFSFAQSMLPPGKYTSEDKKAIKYYHQGMELFDKRQNTEAVKELEKAIRQDPNFVEPHLLLADIYLEDKNSPKAIDEYINALAIQPEFSKNTYFRLGTLQASLGKYAEGKANLEKFLSYEVVDPDFKQHAQHFLANCIFALDALQHPSTIKFENMGDAINSPDYEYFPSVTSDDQVFIFTRNVRKDLGDGRKHFQEDFYISKKINGKWAQAQYIANVNTPQNEGAPNLSSDGQFLFFAACLGPFGYGEGRKGMGSCDIFYSDWNGNAWGKAYNIGPPVNSNRWETQPSFSSDGKTLYFISDRMNGKHMGDIWYSVLQPDNKWGTPVMLGPKINTPQREEAVYIHPDNQTLYFASDGHVGMGGLDLYMCKRQANGEWGEPINLGYPINTFNDESGILVSGSGEIAYIGSDREGGKGGLDIWQFPLPTELQPEKITYYKGKVYDARSKKPLAATFELINLDNATTIASSISNSFSGEFLMPLNVKNNYALNVAKEGYLFYSENFSLKEQPDSRKPFLKDVPLQPIDTGMIVELKNVFFETAKYDLKPESKVELDKLVAFLKSNPTLRIELSGHTDNVGEKKSNLLLSQNRAKAVHDYLIKGGIDAKRLTYKGYGDTRPKVLNDTPENRALNRRTEFKVIGK